MVKFLKQSLILSLIFLWATNVHAFSVKIYPRHPLQGDPVMVTVKGNFKKVYGEVFGHKVRFEKYKKEWVGLFGVDLEKREGKYSLKVISIDKNGKKKVRKIPFTVGYRKFAVQKLTVSKRFDTLSASDLARIRKESSMIRALFKINSPLKWRGPFLHPLGKKFFGVKGHRFGARRIINGVKRHPHTGADYPAPKGTPVYAPNDGVVVLTGNHFFAGNSIYIDHGGGWISMYFHLSKILVKKGQKVKKGEKIGEVGATGRVTGPHLHFGVYWMGNRVDPDKLLSLPIPQE